MLLTLPAIALLFAVIGFGLGWVFVARLAVAPAEKVLCSVGVSIAGIFLFAWVVFITRSSPNLLWALPVLALVGLAGGHRELKTALSDPTARRILAGQAIVSLWCLGWLPFITSFSGGGWAGDWIEHWERTRFFLEQWPRDSRFIGVYTLPARPPLANVVTGALVHLGGGDFASFQVVTALLASLAYLPAACLAVRWGGIRAAAILAVVCMASPLFVQNATFPWTKLPAAFYVLASLSFFLRLRDPAPPPHALCWWAGLMAAALLTHYSAAPYLLVMGGWWLVAGFRPADADSRRQAIRALVTGLLILVPWFAWSIGEYGVAGTFLSNTSVTSEHVRSGNQFLKIALNLRDTLVPHFLRPLDSTLIAQQSPWGWWRDWFFQVYQVNLPFAVGSLGWIVVARESWRLWRTTGPAPRSFWAWFVGATIVIGVAVHGARDHWGLAHICLQPLILIGLAFLAARWSQLNRWWRGVVLAGAAVDLVCGIALHFAVQGHVADRWSHPGWPAAQIVQLQSWTANMNFAAKLHFHLAYVADVLAAPQVTALVLLAVAVLLAIWLLADRSRVGRPPGA